MICLLYAHPYPHRSRANKVLLQAVADVPGLELRSLYDLYPDFAIDVDAEQAALTRAKLIVLQHPIYWYSVPGLLKHWFDKVLALHWAYGDGGVALHGKTCLWVTSTGAPELGYQDDGMHRRPFRDFVPAIEQTARFCGMHWAEPLVVFGAHRIGHDALVEHGRLYRDRLLAFAAHSDEAQTTAAGQE